jgi:hypothetical protein
MRELIITPLGHLAIKNGGDYYIVDGVGMLWGVIPGFTSLDFQYRKN